VLNANAAVESAAGRSSADAIVLRGLDVSRPRRPLDAVRAGVKATWLDGDPVTLGATASCRISAGGRAIPASSSLIAGVGRCYFTLPRWSLDKEVTGRLTLSAPGRVSSSAHFHFAVRPAR
jgi:hypothetical protein